MLIFALYVQTDRKLTVVNYTEFVSTATLRYRLPNLKRKNSNIDKDWCKPKLLSCQPNINNESQVNDQYNLRRLKRLIGRSKNPDDV